eukprot:TRINITY_DN3383_c0_g1_i1.p1 TRINITY_DN3383_c0_g1~~TRINITY_DN3383_c0_g1_i1.p1  ORF type:complete len:167 (-),score=40.42 TRINITY_DN3383_c0_g1_i1:85-585(-)
MLHLLRFSPIAGLLFSVPLMKTHTYALCAESKEGDKKEKEVLDVQPETPTPLRGYVKETRLFVTDFYNTYLLGTKQQICNAYQTTSEVVASNSVVSGALDFFQLPRTANDVGKYMGITATAFFLTTLLFIRRRRRLALKLKKQKTAVSASTTPSKPSEISSESKSS